MSVKVSVFICEKCRTNHKMFELVNPDNEASRTIYDACEEENVLWLFRKLVEDEQG